MVNETRSAARMAEDGIKDYIRTHRLRPGDVLPSETVLCETINCSRSSLREAVRTLSSLDVVEVRHGHGTFVSDMSLEPIMQGLLLRITLNPEESLEHLRHVIDVRAKLDHAAAEELCAHFAGTDLSELRGLYEDMVTRFRAGDPAPVEYTTFHDTIHAAIANPLCRELAGTFIRLHIESYRQLEIAPPRDVQVTSQAHAALIEALRAGDVEAYHQAVDDHYRPLRRL